MSHIGTFCAGVAAGIVLMKGCPASACESSGEKIAIGGAVGLAVYAGAPLVSYATQPDTRDKIGGAYLSGWWLGELIGAAAIAATGLILWHAEPACDATPAMPPNFDHGKIWIHNNGRAP